MKTTCQSNDGILGTGFLQQFILTLQSKRLFLCDGSYFAMKRRTTVETYAF